MNSYQESLDYIFSSYMRIQPKIKNLKQQDYKKLHIIGDILREYDLIPNPKKVIKITGSKGKGTTARTLAKILQQGGKNRVGLFVSPEEFCHNDRISINDEHISKDVFSNILSSYKDVLESKERNFVALDYFSPFGLFLLIALRHFKETNVDYIVLECGRGVRYDDTNSIPSNFGIITSIFKEHMSYFGNSLEDIFDNKVAIAETSAIVLCPDNLKKFQAPNNIKFVDRHNLKTKVFPSIYLDSFHLAYSMAEEVLGIELIPKEAEFQCSSFGDKLLNSIRVIYDCIIDTSGFSKEWIDQYRDAKFILSLPDDKNVDDILNYMRNEKLDYSLITLSGKRGYLDYAQTAEQAHRSYHYSDTSILNDALNDFSNTTFVFLGTQTFIRTIKQSLNT